MGKTRNTGKLATQIQFDNNNNLIIGSSPSSILDISGSIEAFSITGSFTGSVFGISDTVAFSSSVNTRISTIEGVNTFTSSASARLNAIEATSASNISRLTAIENKTGSLATTGSNTFYGTQVFTGSVYITSDLIVQGSSSLQNITGSSVNIGTNTVVLNTANPAVRYAGISVIDSGSTGLTGSILWDSTNNNWLYQNPSGSSYTSAKFIAGPQSQTLGSELGLSTNFLMKAIADDHISSSAIYDDGTKVTIYGNTMIISSSGYIGIGTATPSRNLHVVSSGTDTTIAATKSGTDSSQIGVDSVAYIGAGGDFTIRTAGFTSAGEKVRITSDGKVGIGTNSPGNKLHVYGGGILIENNQDIRTKNSSGTQRTLVYMNSSNKVLLVNDDGDIVLSATGNVGISTASPGKKLDVYDANTNGTDDIIRAYQNITTNHAWYRSQRNGGANMVLGATRDNVDGNISADVSIIWNSSNHSMVFGTNNTERLRITSDGKIGIGTNAPGYPLHILRYAGSSGTLLLEGNDTIVGLPSITFKNNNGATTSYVSMTAGGGVNINGALYATGSNNVGIGNTNPKTRLQVTPQSNAEVPVLGTATGVAIFTSANTNYGLQFNSTSDGSFHIQSQRFDNSATSYALVLQPAGGTVAIGGNSSAAALTIAETETKKISYIGNYSIRTTRLFKTFNQGSTTDYWARITLNNSYADSTQGVYGVITVGWHPYHASMGRFNQYRFFQSPYSTNNSYMKIQTVFEEAFGWDYYTFSNDVTFYNYQSYLYMKITGTNANYNWARSIQAELTGGSYAMDNVNLEIGVSAPASLSGLITKNGSAALSG